MEIAINRDEVLRYLGHRGQEIDTKTELILDETIAEAEAVVKPRYTYRIFDIEKEQEHISVKSTNVLLQGRDICSHLQDAPKCALMAATIGPGIDEKVRFYSRIDMTKAVVFDASSTAAVEVLCDMVSAEIEAVATKQGLFTTTRFSPGYGDLPLAVQSQILNSLDAHKKIGLANTQDFILTPQKSVTAVIGFVFNKQSDRAIDCTECLKFKDCIFRREGRYCDNREHVKQ